MGVLIVNVTLAGRSGTEVVVRDLALGLRAAGHEAMVYSPRLGEIAQEISRAGIPVADDLRALPEAPDVIHGNHHVELVAALLRFPKARGIFVCHDRLAYWSAPPRMARILKYVAVDLYCRARLTDDYGIPVDQTRVILNAVDTARFALRPGLPSRPARAAIFSNYAGAYTHVEPVQAACDHLGIPLDIIGEASGNSSPQPENLLGRYDLVFAKARCALESMAVGAAVVLCDTHGLGPMVTTANLPMLQLWNFGRRTLTDALDPMAIVAQVQHYDPDNARAVSQWVRQHATLEKGVAQYVELYRDVMALPAPSEASFETDVDDYLQHSAARIARLATDLEELRQPYRMEPLSDAAAMRIGVTICTTPSAVARGAAFRVAVQVVNRGSQPIASYPPCPLRFSYRWLDAATGAIVVSEGLRTELRPPLQPDDSTTYDVRVVAPSMPGRAVLRVTFVQEWVMWLDILDTPVMDHAPIDII